MFLEEERLHALKMAPCTRRSQPIRGHCCCPWVAGLNIGGRQPRLVAAEAWCASEEEPALAAASM